MTDPRFGDKLLRSVQKLPLGSGVILRHYGDPQRDEIAAHIAKICRRRGLMLVIAGNSALRCNGHYYGRPINAVLRPRRMSAELLMIGVHDIYEMNRARPLQPDLLLLSPIFATNSHKGARPMGALRFRQLAACSTIVILALGGMNRPRAKMLGHGYAAIDAFIG